MGCVTFGCCNAYRIPLALGLDLKKEVGKTICSQWSLMICVFDYIHSIWHICCSFFKAHFTYTKCVYTNYSTFDYTLWYVMDAAIAKWSGTEGGPFRNDLAGGTRPVEEIGVSDFSMGPVPLNNAYPRKCTHIRLWQVLRHHGNIIPYQYQESHDTKSTRICSHHPCQILSFVQVGHNNTI